RHNAGISIDLLGNGTTPNDTGDADEGPNRLQNAPVFTSASYDGSMLSARVAVPTLPANAAYPLRIDVYTSASGEGAVWLGTRTIASADAGTAVSVAFTPAGRVGDEIVATATDADGNTSEFSAPAPLALGLVLNGSEGWRMLGAPTPGATIGSLLGPIHTQGFPGADSEDGTSNVYRYAEASGAYASVGSASEAWPSGEGRFVYVYEDDDLSAPEIQGGFPKVLAVSGASPAAPFTFGLTYTASNVDARGPGWNLLANPFTQAIAWDAAGWTKTDVSNSVHVWDPNYLGGSYRVWNGLTGSLEDGVIPQGNAFWVQAASASAALTVPEAAKVGREETMGRTASSESETDASSLAFRLASEARPELGAEAFVVFADGATDDLDRTDAWVLTPLVQDFLTLGSGALADGLLAIDARGSEASGTLEIPLEVRAVAGGAEVMEDLVLSWPALDVPEAWTLSVLDTETDAHTDLRASSEIRFTTSGRATAASPVTPDAPSLSGGPLADGAVALKGGDTARFVLRIATGLVTDAEDAPEAPEALRLLAPAPNPSRGDVQITFEMPTPGEVDLAVYDALGREVSRLASGAYAAGRHALTLDGRSLPSGVYVVRLVASGEARTARVTLVR
ncbi:MAG: T9SS type A sorting domain-containing protein, partial [Bacteroidota bacterium]